MSFAAVGFAQSFFRPRITQSADTVITTLCPPRHKLRTKITKVAYTSAGTQHTLTFMRPLGRTTVYAAAAAAATSLVLTRDPGKYTVDVNGRTKAWTPSVSNNLIAASDYIVVRKPDGTFLVTTPSVVATDEDGLVTLTVSALPTGGIAAGADVWFLGVIGDTDPNTNETHPAYAPTTSATTTYGDNAGSFVETFGLDEPILIHSGNATAAGKIEYVQGIYGP
jgi:hypothetical protein